MTEIVFYHHVADPLRFVLRLTAKICAQGRKVRIATSDAAMTAELSRLMWMEPATGFLPHVNLGHRLALETPVLLDDLPDHRGPADVLINLSPVPPAFFSRFEKLAEIVGDAEDSVSAGRERWRFYTARGYPMQRHDMREARNA
jgi:DNA polymerase-3 subunit chi